MSYRYMRMILMFDMPTDTVEERKAYRKFRKFLLNEGFIMHQFSIYSKLLLNNTANKAMVDRLQENNPKKGSITLLTVTEKQFSRMIYLNGDKDTSVANSDERVVFLGRLMMLKINFPILDEPLSLAQETVLVVEDVTVFSSLVKHFYQYQEDDELKLYDEKMKSLKASELMLVTDILGYDVNAPAMLKLIHADIEAQLNTKPEVKSMIEKLASTITELISFECLENELDLEYDEITVLELIKALGIKIETASDSIFEKCFEILQTYHYLSKKKLLVFVNVGAYLTKDEVEKVVEYIRLSHQTVLFIEPRRLYDFPQYVLDEDYFLSSENML